MVALDYAQVLNHMVRSPLFYFASQYVEEPSNLQLFNVTPNCGNWWDFVQIVQHTHMCTSWPWGPKCALIMEILVWSLYVSCNNLLYHSFGCTCYTGGATYCAVATLKLVGRLAPKSENSDKFVALLPGHESLIGWCLRVGLLSHCVTVFVQILICYVIWSWDEHMNCLRIRSSNLTGHLFMAQLVFSLNLETIVLFWRITSIECFSKQPARWLGRLGASSEH